MNQSAQFEVDEKYTFAYFFQSKMEENNVSLDEIITGFQLNSFTAGISENRVRRMTTGLAKPDQDELHLLLELIKIPYSEYDRFMRLRHYYLKLAAGDDPEELGPPPS